MIAALLLLSLVTYLSDARADDPASTEEDRRARKLYLEGESHYAAGRYEEAAGLFEKAYELSGRAALLFNSANCYERMGEYEEAAEYLRRYLESPAAKDVVSVRQRVERLEMAAEARRRERERLRERQPAPREANAPRESPDKQPPVPAKAPGDRRTSTQDQVGFALVATGGAGFVGALVFGVASAGAGRDAEELCGEGGLCSTSAKSVLDREKRFALLSDISVGIGVLAAGIGTYLLLRDEGESEPEEKRAATRVSPLPLPGGAGAGLSGSF